MLRGTLHENHGTWYVHFRVVNSSGKTIHKCLSTGVKVGKGTKRMAERKMHDILRKWEDIVPDDITVEQYVKKFLKSKTGIQPTTMDAYMHVLNTHIIPYFSTHKIKIHALKPEHIERYYERLQKERELSRTTAHKDHVLLKMAIKHAYRNEYISRNIMDLVDPPAWDDPVKPEKKGEQRYNAEQVKQLFTVVKGAKLEIPVLLGAMYGLRRSEILGLHWSDIDFKNHIIHIRHKVVRIQNPTKPKGKKKKSVPKISIIESDTLKTKGSKVDFPLNDQLAEILKAKKDLQNAKSDDYVCVDENGELLKPDYVSQAFAKLLKKHHLPHLKFHGLRHSFVSILSDLGYNPTSVQHAARHASIRMTADVYTHTDEGTIAAELDSLAKLLLSPNEEKPEEGSKSA